MFENSMFTQVEAPARLVDVHETKLYSNARPWRFQMRFSMLWVRKAVGAPSKYVRVVETHDCVHHAHFG